jgi:hypothetical protein
MLALSLLACATIGTLQRAQTVGEGDFEWAIEPGYWGVSSETTGVALPYGNIAARWGLTDRVDIGGRVGFAGTEFLAKARLTGDDAPVVVSVAPTVGGLFAGGGGFINAQLPVIVDVPVGKNALVLAPKISTMTATVGGEYATLWSAGASMGYALRLSDTVTVLPEFARVWPVGGTYVGTYGSEAQGVGDANVSLHQASVAFVFGR